SIAVFSAVSFLALLPPSPRAPLFPYTTLFRSYAVRATGDKPLPPAPGPSTVGEAHSSGGPRPARPQQPRAGRYGACVPPSGSRRSEEHTSELQSRFDLVCRLLLEKQK